MSNSYCTEIIALFLILVTIGMIIIIVFTFKDSTDGFKNLISFESVDNDKDFEITFKNKKNNRLEFNIIKNKGKISLTVPTYESISNTLKKRGLVITATGKKYRYVTGLYMNIYCIRKLYKSTIPIEIIYVGKEEKFSPKFIKLLDDLDVKVYDLLDRLDTKLPLKKLKGYRSKPLALLASSFEEAVLMDADALSFRDPESFFEMDCYKKYGMVLFKDYVNCLHYINSKFLDTIGIGSENYCEKTDNFEIDSSCVIINKKLAWEALYTICLINVESSAYYGRFTNNVLGDKDTWLIGSLFVDFDPFVISSDPGNLLYPTKNEEEVRAIFGHLQFDETNVPLYYNNQVIDIYKYNSRSLDGWGYTRSKNVKQFQVWNSDFQQISKEMIQTFEFANKAVTLLVDEKIVKPLANTGSYGLHPIVMKNFI